jgi:hypothetical protein
VELVAIVFNLSAPSAKGGGLRWMWERISHAQGLVIDPLQLAWLALAAKERRIVFVPEKSTP